MDNYALTFTVMNIAVAPFWIAMIFAPNWSVTQRIMRCISIIFWFCLPYALLNIPYYFTNLPIFARGKLPEIVTLFSDPHTVVLGWIHFLAVDLLAGRWIYFDSRERGYSPWLVGPCLLLCLMVGPTGICLYLLLRKLKPAGTSLATI